MSKKIAFEKVKTFYKDVAEYVPEGAELERKNDSMAEIKAVENFGIEAVFSAPTTDREGDIIYPLGCVSDYYTGTVIFNHDLSALPIGRCDDIRITPDGIKGVIKLSETYDFARDIYGLVKEKILQGISIGFIPLEVLSKGTRAFSDFVSKTGLKVTEATERIVSKFELIEVSVVPVGCNRDALIYGLASKSLSFEDTKTEKAFGIDVSAKEIINLKAQLLEKENALIEAKTALESIETKAVSAQVPIETKAQTEAPKPVNPADLSWQAYVRVLMGQETALTEGLNAIWNDATETISKIDTRTSDIPEIAAQLDGVLSTAAGKADELTKTEVEKIAKQVFAGYRTGYDGVTPIRDIEQVDKWREQFITDYMATMQPDPSKPIQAQSIEAFKNDFLRSAQAETELPTLDMSKSNADTANMSVFGGQRDILGALLQEAGTGDLVQVRGIEDERLCDACLPFLDQFLSVSGKSENFPSVQSAKDAGWGHINCRCVLEPVASPNIEKAFKKVSEKAVAKALAEIEAKKPLVTIKAIRIGPAPIPEVTEEIKAKALALAQGKLVYL